MRSPALFEGVSSNRYSYRFHPPYQRQPRYLRKRRRKRPNRFHDLREDRPEEGDYIHTLEGPDDTTSHLRMALTRTSEVVPIAHGQMTPDLAGNLS